MSFENAGVSVPPRVHRWIVRREDLLREAARGDIEASYKSIALNQAYRAFKELRLEQPKDQREEKLHVGAALVLRHDDGNVVTLRAYNNKNEHAEVVLMRRLHEYFTKTYGEHYEKERLPKMASLAISGTHGNEELQDKDVIVPDEIDARDMPVGMLVPCFKCLRLLQRASKQIKKSREHNNLRDRDINFPVLVEYKNKSILETDFNTAPNFWFAGSKQEDSFSEKMKTT